MSYHVWHPVSKQSMHLQESALTLLKKRYSEPEWDKVMISYWDSLPQRGELLTKETFPAAKLGLLQDASMVMNRHPRSPQ